MPAVDPTELVDKIYEAAVVPELWHGVLDDLTTLGGGVGASFITGGQGPMRWVATPVIDQLIAEFGRQSHPNPRVHHVMAHRWPGWVTDQTIFDAGFIESHPFYTEFMRPRGVGWCIGTAIFPPALDPIIFAVEKRYGDGPVDRALIGTFDGFRPHLARAAMLSARLALERARAAVEMLDILGLPGAVLGRDGRLAVANASFESLTPTVAADRRARLTLADRAADALFAEALARDAVGADGAVRSIPIPRSDPHAPMILHLLPVRGVARDVFTAASTVLVFTPVSPAGPPSAQLLEGLFDLTPAEAQVARELAARKTLAEAAGDLGVSRETVRSQLKAVFAKTGTSRQAELLQLLGALDVRFGAES